VVRNIANMVKPEDTGMTSVIRYAVEDLKVKHIIVCGTFVAAINLILGHTGCGGVKVAFNDKPHWLVGLKGWLFDLRAYSNWNEFKKYPDGLSRLIDTKFVLLRIGLITAP